MAIRGYIACSADGYIAKHDGSVAFLDEFAQIDCGYDDFIASIQTIIMGRKTYEAIAGFGVDWPYPNQTTWVISSHTDLPQLDDSVSFWQGDLAGLMAQVNQPQYGDTWVLGGAQLQSACIEAQHLDTLEVYVMPVLLGDGIALFPQSQQPHRLKNLSASMIADTVIKQVYHF